MAYRIDNLDDYPSLESLFRERGLTAEELDKFLSFMENGITFKETPGIMRDDMGSLHGDAVILYADLVGPEHV